MTSAHIHTASTAAARCDAARVRFPAVGRVAFLAAAMLLGSAACKDSTVPFFTEPVGVDNTPGGIQNAITGLFASSRIEVGGYLYWMTQFARDQGNIQFDNPQDIQEGTGLTPIPSGDAGIWDNEYRSVGGALAIIAAVPNAQPAYTAQQAAAIIGIAQTIEAMDLMAVAETRDTLGIPIHTATNGSLGTVYCNKDAWAQIVAMLDSANAQLATAGSVALPVKLPPGFGAVGVTAGPASAAGSFASFNRALAGKANLEWAYAKARGTGGAPTPSSAGTLDASILTTANNDFTSSALYTVPTPPPAGGFVENGTGVFWDWSAQSGDLTNPVFGQIGIWRTLAYLTHDVDTVADQRFINKFVQNTFPLQIPGDAFFSTTWLYDAYPGTATPIPIIRNETMYLERAQVQLGLGNLAAAAAIVDTVHQQAGGFATPLNIALTYTAVRDTLLKEQRISTVFEYSGDRTISLRMYGLQAIADTTWSSGAAPTINGRKVDLHTTIVPVPNTETEGRAGSYSLTCS